MIRSPFPDVEIPDMPFTDFVLERAGERGGKAALIDGPSGRTITYPDCIEGGPYDANSSGYFCDYLRLYPGPVG